MKSEFVSLAEIASLDLPLDSKFCADADANATVEIVPAGEYRVEIAFLASQDRWQERQSRGRKPRKYSTASLNATVVEGEHAGKQFRLPVSTMEPFDEKESQAIRLLRALGIDVPKPRTQRRQQQLLDEALSVPKTVTVYVEWRAWHRDARHGDLKGYRRMAAFPQDAEGNHLPEVALSDGSVARALLNVIRWGNVKSPKERFLQP